MRPSRCPNCIPADKPIQREQRWISPHRSASVPRSWLFESQLFTSGQCTHYERAPCLRRQSVLATHACGDFAPTPPGFSALVPLPIGSFTGQRAEGGRRSIPLYRSRPLSRCSGCFPAWPYPPLSSGLIVLRLRKAGVCAAGSGSMTLDLGGSGPSQESPSPQGGTQHAE